MLDATEPLTEDRRREIFAALVGAARFGSAGCPVAGGRGRPLRRQSRGGRRHRARGDGQRVAAPVTGRPVGRQTRTLPAAWQPHALQTGQTSDLTALVEHFGQASVNRSSSGVSHRQQ